MIVRDEEPRLASSLRSARPWVREMIVVDTGSTDRTVAIARKEGARVEHFAWCDDFAAARNVSLGFARLPWILVLDADEELLPGFGKQLRTLCTRAAPQGWALDVEDFDRQGQRFRVFGASVRLFRNLPELRYRGRVHEMVSLSERQEDLTWLRAPRGPHLRHSGYDPSLLATKGERAVRLARRMLEDDPRDALAMFHLARTYARTLRDPDEARRWAARCELADPLRERLLPSQWAYLATIAAS